MKICPTSVLDEVVARIVGALHPLQVYLFGSHASGTADDDSDIDLLVVVPDDVVCTRELARLGRKSLWGMRVPVDIVVCTSSEMKAWSQVSCNLVHTVVQRGKLLYAARG